MILDVRSVPLTLSLVFDNVESGHHEMRFHQTVAVPVAVPDDGMPGDGMTQIDWPVYGGVIRSKRRGRI